MSFNLAKLLELPSKPIPITAQDAIIKFWTDFENAKSRANKTGYIITWIIPEELSNIKSYPVNENYAYSGITHIYYYL